MRNLADTTAPKFEQASETAAWVGHALAGSERAFRELYQRHLPLVRSILMAKFRRARADELCQDCFVRAFQQLRQLEAPEKFAAWISSIARRLRDDEAQEDHEIQLQDLPVLHLAEPASAPEQLAEAQQLLRHIRSLPECFSETLLMRLLEGLSGEEIAAISGLTAASVRVNLHRGMQKLREQISLKPGERS